MLAICMVTFVARNGTLAKGVTIAFETVVLVVSGSAKQPQAFSTSRELDVSGREVFRSQSNPGTVGFLKRRDFVGVAT